MKYKLATPMTGLDVGLKREWLIGQQLNTITGKDGKLHGASAHHFPRLKFAEALLHQQAAALLWLLLLHICICLCFYTLQLQLSMSADCMLQPTFM